MGPTASISPITASISSITASISSITPTISPGQWRKFIRGQSLLNFRQNFQISDEPPYLLSKRPFLAFFRSKCPKIRQFSVRVGGGGGGGRPLAPPRFPPLALGLCIYFRKRLLMGLYSLVHICLRLYHYASTCRRNTGKVQLKSTFPTYRRCNCGTPGNRRTNVHIIYVLKLLPASSPVRRRHVAGTYVNQAYQGGLIYGRGGLYMDNFLC